MTHVRLAYRTFQMFYEMNTNSSVSLKQWKTLLGHNTMKALQSLVAVVLETSTWIQRSLLSGLSVKVRNCRDWNKDKMYNDYLLEFVKKEPGMRALERTITYFATWAEENGTDFNRIFPYSKHTQSST